MKSDIVHKVLNLPRLSALKSEPPAEALRICTARVRELDTIEHATFVERGMILFAVDANDWWKAGPYTSFNAWLKEAVPVGRSSGYAAKSTYASLKEAKIPMEEARTIPRCNLQILAKLSPGVARKQLQAARELPEKEFRAHVAKNHPEQHIEAVKPETLKFTESQWKVWETAVQLVHIICGTRTAEEAAEALANEFIQSHQDDMVSESLPVQEAVMQ